MIIKEPSPNNDYYIQERKIDCLEIGKNVSSGRLASLVCTYRLHRLDVGASITQLARTMLFAEWREGGRGSRSPPLRKP